MTKAQKDDLSRNIFAGKLKDAIDMYLATKHSKHIVTMFELITGEMGRVLKRKPGLPKGVRDELMGDG